MKTKFLQEPEDALSKHFETQLSEPMHRVFLKKRLSDDPKALEDLFELLRKNDYSNFKVSRYRQGDSYLQLSFEVETKSLLQLDELMHQLKEHNLLATDFSEWHVWF